MRITVYFIVFVMLMFLSGCADDPNLPPPTPAPVVDGVANQARNSAMRYYRVQAGDTLYSIAWRFALDYNDLARINQLSEPYTLHVGQRLQLKSDGSAATSAMPTTTHAVAPISSSSQVKHPARSRSSTAKHTAAVSSKPINKNAPTRRVGGLRWQWPVQGVVIAGQTFGKNGNKGIDVSGRKGQPIVAAADGKVVYRGSGLRGYGRLIIIKHNDKYLSAYAHNSKLLVKEGQIVKAGQQIAEMGNSDARRVQLHFEIRKQGKPVNPLKYLPKG